MEHCGFPKPKVTRSLGFRVKYENRGYQCLEPNGSLKPGCRRLLYCPTCDAPECVFGGLTFKQIQAGARVKGEGKKKKPISQRRREAHSRASLKSVAEKRARGLTPRNKPLKETCWNCTRLRGVGAKFVCVRSLGAKPLTKYGMRGRTAERMGCQSFKVRLDVEIARL